MFCVQALFLDSYQFHNSHCFIFCRGNYFCWVPSYPLQYIGIQQLKRFNSSHWLATISFMWYSCKIVSITVEIIRCLSCLGFHYLTWSYKLRPCTWVTCQWWISSIFSGLRSMRLLVQGLFLLKLLLPYQTLSLPRMGDIFLVVTIWLSRYLAPCSYSPLF